MKNSDRKHVTSLEVGWCAIATLRAVEGYLAHRVPHPPMTLQEACTGGLCMCLKVVPGGLASPRTLQGYLTDKETHPLRTLP